MADAKQLPYLLELLDDESPLVRETVTRELASFGSNIFDDIRSLPIEINPKERTLLNVILERPRRSFLKCEWPLWFGLTDDRKRLESALSLLAEYQSGLEFRGRVGSMLDELAEEYRGKHKEPDAHSLAEFLFQYKGFRGAMEDYYNPHNSNLVYVMKHRRGIPISLSCVYMLVGWRLGLSIRGCNSPRHFLTIVDHQHKMELVDCFHDGRVVGEKDIVTLSRESSFTINEALKMEADSFSIIRRVLGNLVFAYQQVEKERESFLMVHLLKEVQMYQELLEKTHKSPDDQGVPEEVSFYTVGQKVQHTHDNWRGIIVDYDLYCTNSSDGFDHDEARPDRNQPWYHVLIHGTEQAVYIAHAHIIQDPSKNQVRHPLVPYFFTQTDDGAYIRNQLPWLD
jgi:hemimethylated DNA binding protein